MAILSKDFFLINGVSSHTVGLYVDTPPMPGKPEIQYTSISIPGRPEPLTMKQKNRAERQVDLNCYLFDDEAYNPDALYAFLESAKTLITSKSDKYQYRVNSLLQIQPTYMGKGKQYLIISYMCSPYRYAVENEPVAVSRTGYMLDNNGTEFCQPQYKIYGNGNINLKVNGETLKIYDVNKYVIVDAEALMVHKDGANVLSNGKLPFLNTGTNLIEYSGTVSKIEITKNERWI